jgi:hypothetical protein
MVSPNVSSPERKHKPDLVRKRLESAGDHWVLMVMDSAEI